jgi:hypothetical protein
LKVGMGTSLIRAFDNEVDSQVRQPFNANLR